MLGATNKGAIHVVVDDDTMTITNVTEGTHEFCCGSVTLRVVNGDDGIYLDVTGAGTNSNVFTWGFNYVASLWFPLINNTEMSMMVDSQYYQQTGHWPSGASQPYLPKGAP